MSVLHLPVPRQQMLLRTLAKLLFRIRMHVYIFLVLFQRVFVPAEAAAGVRWRALAETKAIDWIWIAVYNCIFIGRVLARRAQ